MNDIKPIPNYSVEIISQLRAQKKQELRESKERIQLLTQELFSPQKSKNKMENMMQHINAGIAAYDGLKTGIMIFQRIHRFFNRKKIRTADENLIIPCRPCRIYYGRSYRKSIMDALLLHFTRRKHHCFLL